MLLGADCAIWSASWQAADPVAPLAAACCHNHLLYHPLYICQTICFLHMQAHHPTMMYSSTLHPRAPKWPAAPHRSRSQATARSPTASSPASSRTAGTACSASRCGMRRSYCAASSACGSSRGSCCGRVSSHWKRRRGSTCRMCLRRRGSGRC